LSASNLLSLCKKNQINKSKFHPTISNLSEEILLAAYKHLLQNETEADLFLARSEEFKQN
jgi:hypothetical protein